MQSDLLSCCICSVTYNRVTHIPKLLPTCGHTICSSCLVGILTTMKPRCCPLDRIHFPAAYDICELFPTNMLVLQLIEEKLKQDNDFCDFHQELKSLICLTDRRKICQYCTDDRQHRGHVIKHINEIKNDADDKRKQLEFYVEDFDLHQKAIENLLKEEKKNLIIVAKEKFEKIREMLSFKEKEIYSEIDSTFTLEKIESDSKLEKDFTLKKSIQAKISDLTRNILDERFFRTLTSPIHPFSAKEEFARLFKVITAVKEHFWSLLEDISVSLASLFKNTLVPFIYEEKCGNTVDIDLENNADPRIREIKNLLKIESQDNQLVLTSYDSFIKSESSTIEVVPSVNQLKETTQINLMFDKGTFTEQMFEAFKTIWKGIKEVNSLDVNFSDDLITDTELSIFCSDSFWATDKITSFYLDLDRSSVSDQSVTKLMMTTLLRMKNIKYFSITLCDTKITDKSLVAYTNHVLPATTTLEDLNLDLCNTQLTDASIKQLFLRMKDGMKSLQMFRLCVSSTKVADKSIEIFCKEALPTMSALEGFKLYLYDTRVTNVGVEYLCSTSTAVWKNIKTFVLSLGKTQITDQSVISLSKNIFENMSSLETFGLFLDHNAKITDTSIKQLCSSMKSIVKNVSVFKLNLQNTGITDKTVESLMKSLFSCMNNLKEVELDVSGTRVTDKSIDQFCARMKGMLINLEGFSLGLKETKVTEKSFLGLIQYANLSPMLGLKSFNVILDDNQLTAEIQSLLGNLQQGLMVKRE